MANPTDEERRDAEHAALNRFGFMSEGTPRSRTRDSWAEGYAHHMAETRERRATLEAERDEARTVAHLLREAIIQGDEVIRRTRPAATITPPPALPWPDPTEERTDTDDG